MHRFKKFIKRFGTDAAGYGLILLGLTLGWLPGPGGIPLVLAGLGLLSVHNHWARRILLYIQENGMKIMNYLFPDNAAARIAHDFIALGLVIGASYLVIFQRSPIAVGIAVSFCALAIVDFLYNRDRLNRFKNK